MKTENKFTNLFLEFIKIKNTGYIKAVNNNSNSCGLTLEKLLNHSGDTFNVPDYGDIEIKTIKGFESSITLFTSPPDGPYFLPMQWLSDNFGYPDKDYRNIRVIKGDVYGNTTNKIGIKYKYKINVNRQEERIELYITDGKKIINNQIYWEFKSLKEKLERKNKYLAVFMYYKKEINNDKYYKYYRMKMHILKTFDDFLKNIENGNIYLTLCTGVSKSGIHKGEFKDHGCGFRINYKNISKMFEEQFFVWDQ